MNGNILALDRKRIGITCEGLQGMRLQAFQQLAHELDEHAGKLEAAACARNAQEVRAETSEVLEYCLACHQQFRDHAAGQR